MKETTTREPTTDYFEMPDYAPISVRENIETVVLEKRSEELALDGFVATVKWIFLYLPGALAIHFIMMAFALFRTDFSVAMLVGTFGVFAVSTFMVMLGLGKLSELKYLKVVAALVGMGGLLGIIYAISTIVFGDNFFG
ncbi:MAG: hypothetical protein ACT4O9_06565 [Blastocatellia bacterium]